jgi:hypothetical protein
MPEVTGSEIPSGDEQTWYLGVAVTAEAVGTGDGSTKDYELDYQSMDYKETIKLDGVAKTRGTDYTVDYTGGTGGVTKITFATAPGAGVVITADYTRAIEFAASSDAEIDFEHETLERSVHGSVTKLKKTGSGSATAKLTDVMVDGDKLMRFVGTATDDNPATGKTKYEWSAANPKTVPWVLGRVLRSSAVVLLVYLENVCISSGAIAMPTDDFFTNEMEWEIDDFELVYDTPT